ncbi:MAG: hypothetical protein SVU69_06870 [Pseudomonadota bacterium]|nr:hypothetical protein [Pseudomonadota bacterium]
MKTLARFAMRGPLNTMSACVALGVGAWFVFPLLYLSAALIGLVTLQLGWRKGLLVAAGSMVGLGGIALLMFGSPRPGLMLGAIGWGPALVVAAIVRNQGALRPGLEWLTVGALLLTGSFFLLLSDPATWWAEQLRSYGEQSGLLTAWRDQGIDAQTLIDSIAPIMPGSIGVMCVVGLGLSIVCSRWLQSSLFKPGAFGEEYRQLRFVKGAVIVMIGLIALGVLGSRMALNFAMVISSLYLFQGLAVLHGLAAILKWNNAVVIGVYVVMFLLPHFALLVAGLGAADSWADFRARWSSRS